MRRICTPIVLFIALWLPLQGIAAIAMPFCKHSLAAQASEAHPGHSQHQSHHSDQNESGTAFTICDDCGHCHLATACTLPSSAPVAVAFAAHAGPSTAAAALIGIVLPRLRPPPLPALL